MGTESNYLVKNPKLITARLNTLIKNRCIITAYFGEPQSSFMTSIISVDQKNNVIELDCAQNEAQNTELLQSSKVLFRAEIDGIKVSFAGKSIKQSKRDGEKIFAMPIPESIFWMQRRQFFRVKIPESHTHCYCEILLKLEASEESGLEFIPHISRFKLADLSITGFSFLNTTPAFADFMRPSQQYQNCTLHFHDDDDSEARISFEIINVNKIRSGRAIVAQRVGCSFSEIPPGFDAIIQRYIQDIEIQTRGPVGT